MGHWRWQTDFYSGWKALAIYGVYLAYLWIRTPFYAGPYYNTSGLPVVGGNIYFYLQLLPCIFIVYITTNIFAESFRPISREYFSTFSVNNGTLLFQRYLRLWALLVLPIIPLCIYAVKKINLGIAYSIAEITNLSGFPFISIWPMLAQCIIAIAFYIALALILLLIFKSRYLPVILVVIYCFMEYGPLRDTLGKYAVFYGSSTSPDLYTVLPPNMYILAGLTVTFIVITCKRMEYRSFLIKFIIP